MAEVLNNTDTQYNTESGYGACYGDHQAANKWKNKGLLTGTLTAQMNPDGTVSSTYLYSVMYYDYRNRLIQSKGNNALAGGLEKEYIAYDFMNNPTGKKHIHSASGKTTQTEVYVNTYDHAERLTKTTHQLNGGTIATIAENSYDELGRLKTNKKGGLANLNATYAYNIRSWIKSISNPLFAENLFYNESYGGSVKRYDGNISAMNWTVSGDKNRGYAFIYDNLSRLYSANYLENGAANDNYKVIYPSYDKQGNIKTLQRYGKTSATTYNIIDNLTLDYTGNQLLKVEDTAPAIALAESNDFKNYSNTTPEYVYNANGAMTKDLNKGISEIQYNSLNLPRLMDIKSPVAEARNEYTYSAAGQKLKVVQKWNPNYSTTPVIGSAINTGSLTASKTTEYIGNMIYENGTLKRILIDGGSIENGVYNYYQTDHQGNNRLVVNSSGTVVQNNHYYPFGTAFAETPIAEQGFQPYKYNSKELDQMSGLNLYDHSARYYESALGRFTSVDPLCEKYYWISPYAYCANNPILYIDPTGMDNYRYDDKTGEFHLMKTTDDKTDKVLGYHQDKKTGEWKQNTGFFQTKTRIDNIEKGILKDGINFKENDNVIAVNGKDQPTTGRVENFVIELSEMVNKEVGGYEIGNKGSNTIDNVYISKYKNNTDQKAYSSFNPTLLGVKSYTDVDLYVDFHTHLSRFPDNAKLRPSGLDLPGGDMEHKRSQIGFGIKKFTILTRGYSPIEY